MSIRCTENGCPIPCIVQEPAYSRFEKRFLRSLDLEVIEDHDAFSMINEGNLVVLIDPYFDVARWTCKGIWLAAIVTNDVECPRCFAADDRPMSCQQQVFSIFQRHDSYPINVDDDDRNMEWGNVQLYRRKLPNLMTKSHKT